MKKYNKYLIVVFLALLNSGCTKFLEERSADRVPLDEAITNEESAVQFLYGAHAKAKAVMFGMEYMGITDFMTDDIDYTASVIAPQAMTLLTFDNNNRYLKTVWSNLYAVIGQCNIFIDKLTKEPELSKGYGEMMIADAKVLRAWAYFNLAELWGAVPLTTKPIYTLKDNLFPPRASKSVVYAQMTIDLLEASTVLPENKISIQKSLGGSSYVYSYPLPFTRAVAKLMLGKVYLFNKQYDEVITTLSFFATPSGYNATYDTIPFNQIFDARYKRTPERVKEVIWEIEAKPESGYHNTINPQICPTNNLNPWGLVIDPNMVTRYQNIIPTYDLIKSYSTSDRRYRQSFRFISSAPSSKPQILKNYDITATDPDVGGPNAIVLRIADAYLMLAEAYNELGAPDVAELFTRKIRLRAGLSPLSTSLSQSQMREAIYLERRLEFACENSYRLFDLRRTGRYADVMKAYAKNVAGLMVQATTEEFIDMATGNRTPAINIPFSSNNKIWQDKLIIHPLPLSEMRANPNLKIISIPNWN